MPENERFSADEYTGLIRSALHPDENKFFKEYLGYTPGLQDLFSPSMTQTYENARALRRSIVEKVLSNTDAISPRATVREAEDMVPGGPWGSHRQAGQPGTTPQDLQISPQAGAPTVPSGMLPPGTTLPSILSPAQGPMPQGIPGGQRLPSTPHMGMLATPETGYPDEPTDQAAGITPPSMPAYAGSPVQQPNALPPPGLLPQGQSSVSQPMGQPVGNENDLLPISKQRFLDSKVHQAGLRLPGTYGRSTAGELKASQYARWQAISSGEEPEHFPGEADKLAAILGATSREHDPNSLAGRNQQADLNKKDALLPTVASQAEATLEKTKAGTEHTQAMTETENKLRQAKYDNIESMIKLRTKQEELAGSQSGSERMKQKFLMVKVMQIGLAQGLFNETDERDILNYVAPEGMEFVGTPPGKFRQFLDNMGITTPGGDQGIHVAPKGTQAPAGGKQDFSDAPPGKKQGQVLNQNGKPVATWSGKAWVPISTK